MPTTHVCLKRSQKGNAATRCALPLQSRRVRKKKKTRIECSTFIELALRVSACFMDLYYSFSPSYMPTFLCFAECGVEGEGETCCGTYDFEGAVFSVQRGDYAYLMEKVSQNLEKAKVDYVTHVFSVQYSDSPASKRSSFSCA